MNGSTGLMIPQGSPKIHPRRVKLEKRENSRNIEENNNSLFMFLSFTPTPWRDARPCVFACVRETGGERVNLEPRRPGSPTLARVAAGCPGGTTRPPAAPRRHGPTWARFRVTHNLPVWQWVTPAARYFPGLLLRDGTGTRRLSKHSLFALSGFSELEFSTLPHMEVHA